MRLVIEAREFAALSRETQLELLGRFTGERWQGNAESNRPRERDDRTVARPINLTPMQAAQLVDSLSEDLRRFLQVFAQRGGRVTLDELRSMAKLAHSEDVSRSLTAIDDSVRTQLEGEIGDKSLFLREHDGADAVVYRVSERTTRSLRCFFPVL